MMNHTNCSHQATSAARRACRASRKALAADPKLADLTRECIAANAPRKTRDRGTMPEGTPKTRTGFPLSTCSRCGGTGQYPSAAWQGKCLGCSGTGYVDFNRSSRRQRIAYLEAVTAAQTTPVTEVAVGDVVLLPYGMMSDKWFAVESIEDDKLNPGRIVLRASTTSCSYSTDATVRRSASVDPAPFLAKINYNAR